MQLKLALFFLLNIFLCYNVNAQNYYICIYGSCHSFPNPPPIIGPVNPGGQIGKPPPDKDIVSEKVIRFLNDYQNEFQTTLNLQTQKALEGSIDTLKLIEEAKKKSIDMHNTLMNLAKSLENQIIFQESFDKLRRESLFNDQLTPQIKALEEKIKKASEEIVLSRSRDNFGSEETRKKIKLNFQKDLLSPDYDIATNKINEAMLRLKLNQSKDALKRPNFVAQVKDVLDTVLNKEGLVKEYIKDNPRLQDYKFNTKIDSSRKLFMAIEMRRAINKALHITQFSYSPSSIDIANKVLDFAIHADELSSKGNRVWSDRYFDRGLTQLNFLTKEKLVFYTDVTLTNKTKSLFNLNLTSDSYENFNIIEAANDISSNLEKNYSQQNHIYADLILNAALVNANNMNRFSFELAIDKAWAFCDFLNGTAAGIVDSSKNFLYGTANMLLYPADTIIGVYDAAMNIDKVSNYVYAKIIETINQYPNMTPEEKGKLIGSMAFEVGGMLVPLSKAPKAGGLLAEEVSAATRLALATEYEAMARRMKLDKIPITPQTLKQTEYYLGNNPAVVTKNWGHENYQKVFGLVRENPDILPILDKWNNGSFDKAGGANQLLAHVFNKKYYEGTDKRLNNIERHFHLLNNHLSNIYKLDDPALFKQSLQNFDKFMADVKAFTIEQKISPKDPNTKFSLIQAPDTSDGKLRYYKLVEYKDKYSTLFRMNSIKDWHKIDN
ncbi:hypothetical protein [Fluviispira multicolorata]|uniref:Uncharacterized protein n=1 Tax=Fluviispira multicolorata TaxID=2654512 RepID=A0A833JFY5_9BACT|nr:hypothetical protein [Fluviispira multicolorata]KAB8033648.1 hypothetical protein GCL57_02770 [Fluviispira multicolorata]